MRQKLITLDPTSFELASKKINFSDWVRNQLRSERNQKEVKATIAQLEKDSDYWYQKYMAVAFPQIKGEEE